MGQANVNSGQSCDCGELLGLLCLHSPRVSVTVASPPPLSGNMLTSLFQATGVINSLDFQEQEPRGVIKASQLMFEISVWLFSLFYYSTFVLYLLPCDEIWYGKVHLLRARSVLNGQCCFKPNLG